MISNIDDVGREADCAAKCYLWTHCAFYFFANNKCYRGRYSVTTSHIGTQNNNVKYYTRNDFGEEVKILKPRLRDILPSAMLFCRY